MVPRGPAAGPEPGLAGVAVVDKPPGWTSHDVVAKARSLLGIRRVGHSGTLDPDATGVLVLGVGRATRLLTYITGLGKSYVGEVVLGTSTSTLDASGDVTATWDMSDVGLADVRAAAAGLTGDLLQVPPMVSAKQVGGRRLHDLARAGVEVDREPVGVHVDRFEVGEPVAPGVFPISVTCSSGTYVRSLAADLGAALGGGAHLRHLRRTAVGPFGSEEAVPLEALTPERLLPPTEALRGRPRVVVDDDVAALVRHGRVFDADALGVTGDGPWAVVDGAGTLLAVYARHPGGTVKPGVVMV
jgi:tRNA pseudouridine55 synthase